MKQSFPHKMMAKIVRFLDPRFDKFRETPISDTKKNQEKEQRKYEKDLAAAIKKELKDYAPQSEKELIQLLARTPREALSIRDRNLISGAMSFSKRRVSLITMPRDDITFLKDKEFLGPLNLDKLYKTGSTIFPVLNKSEKVCGLLRTDKLDLLHITKDQPVTKLMEHNVVFAREDYTLEQLLAVFLRNHTDYALIVDKNDKLIGYAELDALIAILFNREIKDDFSNDASSISVAQREL